MSQLKALLNEIEVTLALYHSPAIITLERYQSLLIYDAEKVELMLHFSTGNKTTR